MTIEELVRPNISALAPYKSARDEFSGNASIWLDANENPEPLNGAWNRYPDPLQRKVKARLAELKGVSPDQIFLGNGSDEAIDLIFRIFCRPGIDSCVVFTPTYGMYKVSAAINDVNVIHIPLDPEFKLPDVAGILKMEAVKKSRVMFVCSPNNPTGNATDAAVLKELAAGYDGILVIDEAYIDFAPEKTAIQLINEFDKVVVLQTFSKAWGLAALRIGMAFAGTGIIGWLNKVKPPYNMNEASQQAALKALEKEEDKNRSVEKLNSSRQSLAAELKRLSFIKKIYPSDANFILIKTDDANKLYQYLLGQGIILRNRNSEIEGCIRITVGTEKENAALIHALVKFQEGKNI